VTAAEFAGLLQAKRVGKGKWVAACPAHEGDGRKHKPSLSIAEGRKTPVVFKCMSQGCSQKSILEAMGLTWRDVLGDREVLTPETRRRWRDEATLTVLREIQMHALYLILTGSDEAPREVLIALEQATSKQYYRLRDRLYPDEAKIRLQRERVHRTIENHGWDAVWIKFLSTERGKIIAQQHGRNTDERGSNLLTDSITRQDVETIVCGGRDSVLEGEYRDALANPFRPDNRTSMRVLDTMG